MKSETEHGLILAFGILIILGVVVFVFNSCGTAHSDAGPRAIEIPSPVNTICYAIVEDGKAVGGNCLWAK